MKLSDMTEDVLVVIYQYLEKQQTWPFVMSSKRIYEELSKHRHYRLNRAYSFMYYMDISFRMKVLERIMLPSNQLFIRLRELPNLSNEDLMMFKDIHSLRLETCPQITDVSMLGGLHELHIVNCQGVIDVSSLGNIHTLYLLQSYYITDVSALGNVRCLRLSGCFQIRDVSALGNVEDLDLSWCYKIYNVSALGRVKRLNLQGCSLLRDISALTNVEYLNISWCFNINPRHVSLLKKAHTIIYELSE
jgi:hypothetical protein